MKFSIPSSDLKDALAKASSIMQHHSSQPALGFLLIEADLEQVSVTSTSSKSKLKITVDAEVASVGSVVVPFKHLAALVPFAKSNIEIELKEGKLRVRFDESRASVMIVGDSEFPDYMPSIKDDKFTAFESPLFASAIKRVLPAVYDKDDRDSLHQACMRGDKILGTNGKVLHIVDLGFSVPVEICIPHGALEPIRKILPESGESYIASSERTVTIRGEGFEFSTLKLEDGFPSPAQIAKFQTASSDSISFEREKLIATLRGFTSYNAAGNFQVIFHIEGKNSRITGGKSGEVDLESNILCGTKIRGFKFSANPHYLIESLNACSDDDVTFLFDSISPAAISQIKGKDFTAAIALMRLESTTPEKP